MRKATLVWTAILVAVAMISPAAAELPFTVWGGAGFGKLMEDNAPDGSIGFGGGILYQLPSTPVIGLGVDLGYQMLGSWTVAAAAGGASGSAEVKWSTIPVTGQVYYLVPMEGSLHPYVCGGAGLYNLRYKYSGQVAYGGYNLGGSSSDSDTKLGVNLGGGVRIGDQEKKIGFGVDAKYHIVMTENESTNVLTAYGRVYFQ